MPVNGSRDVYLANGCTGATPGHEIFHVLGRDHEQSRPDRNQYVTVFPENFDNSKWNVNFY